MHLIEQAPKGIYVALRRHILERCARTKELRCGVSILVHAQRDVERVVYDLAKPKARQKRLILE